TSLIHGHRHVLYFGDDGPVIDSVAEATDTPAELWQALGDRPALTIPHHPAGGPIAIDWDVAPDPRFEPVAEIVSIHGSSAPPERLEVVRSGAVVDGIALEGRLEATLASDIADLASGEWVYVRVAQSDGGAAWSSPIFIGESGAR